MIKVQHCLNEMEPVCSNQREITHMDEMLDNTHTYISTDSMHERNPYVQIKGK
jgi:hypothetical protein